MLRRHDSSPAGRFKRGLGLLQPHAQLRRSTEVDLHSDKVLIDEISGVDVGVRVAGIAGKRLVEHFPRSRSLT